MAAGVELSSNNVLVASGVYANVSAFNTAVQGVKGATAGDAIAWADSTDQNTYAAVFEGAGLGAGQAHGVGLTGVSAASGITAANGGIHVARTLSL